MRYVIAAAQSEIGSVLAQRLAQHELLLLRRDPDLRNLEAVEAAVSAFGEIDGIVNCAGSLFLKPAHLTTALEFQEAIDANLTTAFNVLRAGLKNMPNGGSIVLISSAAARIGLANHEAIAAAKAGVIGLALSAAASYAKRNVRVNCVAPGLVDTKLTTRITSNETALQGSTSMHALGRIGKADDVASMIEFLLDPANSWITGQVFGVDGGLGTLRGR